MKSYESIDSDMPQLLKIVSGGQTGADRAALDAAIEHGAPCGGWCPEGRLAEDGRIPDRYPLREVTAGGYRQRTLQNINDSDGTVVFYFGRPRGGTEVTLYFCIKKGKPYQLIDAGEIPPDRAAELIRTFISEFDIAVLNVAGRRASEEPRAYPYVFEVIGPVVS
jgi:hypothetical protein